MRSVKAGMLVMGDRGFHDYEMVVQVRQRGAHVLSRLPASVKPTGVRSLADGAYLAYLKPSDYQRRKKGERLLVRVIEYTTTDPILPGWAESHRLVYGSDSSALRLIGDIVSLVMSKEASLAKGDWRGLACGG